MSSRIEERISRHGKSFMGKDDKCVYKNFISFLPEGIESTLSVGCGEEELSYLPGKVTGLDINPKFVKEDVVLGDMHDIPFSDNEFELVWVKDVLEHAVSPIVAISEFSRVSSKYVMIILPTDRWLEDSEHILIPTLRQLISMANKEGLYLMKEGVSIFTNIHTNSGRVRIQEFNYYLFRKII